MLIKLRLSPSKKKLLYLLQWKLFKNDGNYFFFFILKALFVVKIFKLLCSSFGLLRTTWLEQKSEFQSLWRHSLVNKQLKINILPDISWSKGNQTMKFGQVKEYNKKNFFLQKSCRKGDRGTSSRSLSSFSKNICQ